MPVLGWNLQSLIPQTWQGMWLQQMQAPALGTTGPLARFSRWAESVMLGSGVGSSHMVRGASAAPLAADVVGTCPTRFRH